MIINGVTFNAKQARAAQKLLLALKARTATLRPPPSSWDRLSDAGLIDRHTVSIALSKVTTAGEAFLEMMRNSP